MRIVPPRQFPHPAVRDSTFAQFAALDPRKREFAESNVDVDLRNCEFVHPPALMWCLIYLLLATGRRAKSRLLVPDHVGTATHLRATGLFALLQNNHVEVDDRGISSGRSEKIVLPLTRLESETQVEELAGKTLDVLAERNLGATNLHPLVSEVFAELAINAVQHSESTIGAYALIQFYHSERGDRLICVVGDGGIGIRASLSRNQKWRERAVYDWTAIELATRERVSGTGDSHRGIGLFGVSEDMRKAERNLIIHSGLGALTVNEDVESEARRVTLFPETLVSAAVPT